MKLLMGERKTVEGSQGTVCWVTLPLPSGNHIGNKHEPALMVP
jgi:hypothetical protein